MHDFDCSSTTDLSALVATGDDIGAAALVLSRAVSLPIDEPRRAHALLELVSSAQMTRTVSALLQSAQIVDADLTAELFAACVPSPHISLTERMYRSRNCMRRVEANRHKIPWLSRTAAVRRFWMMRHLVQIDRQLLAVKREIDSAEKAGTSLLALHASLLRSNYFGEIAVSAALDLVKKIRSDPSLVDRYADIRKVAHVLDAFERDAQAGTIDYAQFEYAIDVARGNRNRTAMYIAAIQRAQVKCA